MITPTRSAAVLLLVSLHATAAGMPPLGCLETSAGARWCVGDRRLPSMPPYVPSGPHPATVVKPSQPHYSVGLVVTPLPVVDLLPHRYALPRFTGDSPSVRVLPVTASIRP